MEPKRPFSNLDGAATPDTIPAGIPLARGCYQLLFQKTKTLSDMAHLIFTHIPPENLQMLNKKRRYWQLSLNS
jgi:hypothetical protein